MALIIWGDLPKDCYECKFVLNHRITNCPLDYPDGDANTWLRANSRHPNCPMIGEIPDEHGRLGDLDLCFETFKLYCQDCKKEIDCYSCWVSDTFDIVKRIPTVLEATNE